MKTEFVILSAIGLAAAAQHRHGHMQFHQKKEASPVDVYVPGPTVVVYSLNGVLVSEAEVLEGIANGTLVWANGAPALATSSSSSSTTFATMYDIASSSSASSSSSSSSTSTSTSSSASASATSSSSNYTVAAGISSTFPDGTIACSDFSSVANYGAVALDYLGLDGWSGIQDPTETLAAGFSDIVTATSGGCDDGNYCSYACPPGYQKSQWPSTQGATGQSIGGLLCKDGYLYKTNDDYDTICITGASEVTVLVRNEMSDCASVCRTDYPGQCCCDLES